MRFLFVSRRGGSLSLATRIASEGHKVNFFVNNLLYKILGQGIIEKTNINESNNSDIVIFDEGGMGEYASNIAKTRKVIGSSIFSDTFNSNYNYKSKVLNKCGLYLSDVKGEEVYTTAWYNGFSFITPFHSYFKKTKFMERDLGIDTECAGCLLFYHKTNKITKAFLTPLLKELKKTGYIGAVNITSNIKSEGLALKDISLGFQYDSLYAALEGLRQDFGETFYRLAFGSLKRIKASEDWLASARVSIPPYPFAVNESLINPTLIEGINENNLKHLWLRDIQYKDGEYMSACTDGYLLSVTARGLAINKAFRRVYRTINNLKIENVQYRTDLCNGLEDKYKTLKDSGWFN